MGYLGVKAGKVATAAIGSSIVIAKVGWKDSRGRNRLFDSGESNNVEASLTFNPLNWFLANSLGQIIEGGIRGTISFKEWASENVYLAGGFIGGAAVGIFVSS